MKGRHSAIHSLEEQTAADLTTKFSRTNRTLPNLTQTFCWQQGALQIVHRSFNFFFLMNFADILFS